MHTGIIIVDHGSRRDESNKMLEQVAELFARRFSEKYDIVEPAHMELAEPSIATAYARCAERGATRIVVVPFFLGPGKTLDVGHPAAWTADVACKFPENPATTSARRLEWTTLILDLLGQAAPAIAKHTPIAASCARVRCAAVLLRWFPLPTSLGLNQATP